MWPCMRMDLREGTLERTVRYEDAAGRRLAVRQLRLIHMADPPVGVLRTELTPEGWSGELEVESGLDGTVTNSGVERYRALTSRHLTHVHTGTSPHKAIWLRCRTRT